MKYLLILSVCIVLSICAGCSSGEHASTKKEDMKIVCIDGVEYFFVERIFRSCWIWLYECEI